jgi:predicted transcriptional regulator
VINSVDTLHFQLGACGIRGASAVSKNKPMSKHQNAPLAPRQEELLQLLAANGQISVDELARHFSVSDDIIRRDLHELERRRVLLRTHGGAVSHRVARFTAKRPF